MPFLDVLHEAGTYVGRLSFMNRVKLLCRSTKIETGTQTHHTWLPEHSEAMSVMDSLCSSRISDRVILLPLLGTSNTRIEPDETPGKREKKYETLEFWFFFLINKYIHVQYLPTHI